MKTNCPSIDKPWLKYYAEEAISVELPKETMYQLILERNSSRLDAIALDYYGNLITYSTFFEQIDKIADALASFGVVGGDVISILSLGTPETIYLIYACNKIGGNCQSCYCNNINSGNCK